MKSKLNPHQRVVVSSDRGNGFRVRQAGENTEHEMHKEVHLYDVEFVATNRHPDLEAEVGFGCGVAALGCIASSPVTEQELATAQQIYFDGMYNFRLGQAPKTYQNVEGPVITRARTVILRRGQLLAIGAT